MRKLAARFSIRVASSVLFSCILLVAVNECRAGIYDSLSDAQRKSLQKRRQVQSTAKVANHSWPRVTILQLVHASAEEVMAVYSNYNRPPFIARIKTIEPTETEDPTVAFLRYTLDLPYLVTKCIYENYTVKNKINYISSSQTYQMQWELVQEDAGSFGELKGEALVEGVSADTSLISYTNFIAPKSYTFLLSSYPVASIVPLGASEALDSIVKQVEVVRAQFPGQLEEDVERLRTILSFTND